MPLAPVLFLSHGAGPAWLVDYRDGPLQEVGKNSASARFMQTLPSVVDLTGVKAVVVISGHWEEEDFTVNTRAHHSLYYDYGGFPKETYNIKWNPKGSPEIAGKIKQGMQAAGLTCKENSTRGLDHGVFIPLMFLWPKADIPVVEISMRRNMKINEHIRFGEILAPLRREGIAVIGSGFTSHKSSSPGKEVPAWASDWRTYIHDIVTNPEYTPEERKTKASCSMTYHSFRHAHPTSDHYIPLPVAMAAGGFAPGEIIYDEFVMGSLLCSHFLFL